MTKQPPKQCETCCRQKFCDKATKNGYCDGFIPNTKWVKEYRNKQDQEKEDVK